MGIMGSDTKIMNLAVNLLYATCLAQTDGYKMCEMHILIFSLG